MRTVNAASRSLSGIVDSGWKYTTSEKTKPSPTQGRLKKPSVQVDTNAAEVEKLAASAKNDLAILRELRPGNIDIERAASSIVGKLISLESVSLPCLTHGRELD